MASRAAVPRGFRAMTPEAHLHPMQRRRESTHRRRGPPFHESGVARMFPARVARAQVGAFRLFPHKPEPSTQFGGWGAPGAGRALPRRLRAAHHSFPPADLHRKVQQSSIPCRLPLPPHRRIAQMAERGWPMDPVLWERRRWDPDRGLHARLEQVWIADCPSTLPADPAGQGRRGRRTRSGTSGRGHHKAG